MTGSDLAAAVVAVACALLAAAALPTLIGRFAPVDDVGPRHRVPGRLACVMLTAALVVPTVARLRTQPAWLPAYTYLVVTGVLLTVVDLRVHRLPDRVTLPSYPVLVALLGLAALADGSAERWLRALLAGLAAALVFGALWALPTGLGLGDVKTAGLLGLALGWFGWETVVEGFLLGMILGGLGALTLLVTRRAARGDWIAYGPYLLAGALLAILLAPPAGAG
jgi:leader peptidase (prepilin peptidase) / N-methyltransferase